MTSDALAANEPVSGGLTAESVMDGVGWLERTLRPNEGWIAAGLLAINLVVVVLSVERADWVPSPNLIQLLFIAMLTGLALYRIPIWSIALLPVGLAIGLGVIFWQLSTFSIDGVPVGGIGQVTFRLELWLDAARDGSINIDRLPFSFALMVATWLTGFLGAWLFLRFGNFWGVFVLGGIGLLSNLTFLPPNTAFHLGMYLFTALLLVARVQAIRRKQEWERRAVRVDDHLAGLSLSDSFGITVVVILVAFFLPVAPKWDPANEAYETMRNPLESMEDDFNRLFAGLPARRPLGFRIWDNVMALQGSIYPAKTQVLWVDSPTELYWKARTYGTYNGQGWLSESTVTKPLGYTPDFTLPVADRRRTEVTYFVTPLYESKKLFSGYQVLEVDRDVMIETQADPVFTLNLAELQQPGSTIPSYLEEVFGGLLQTLEKGNNQLVSDAVLARSLPTQFRLDKVDREDGQVLQVQIKEALPAVPEVLSVTSPKGKFKVGDPYQVTSAISQAEPEELLMAGTDYPAWVSDRYLQLPSELPERIGNLAAVVTSENPTPYEKAKSVEDYLRTSYPYNLRVDPPPFGTDGVDHFLFGLQQGYSEYFGSTMAVMLRTVGVPARLAVGYTTGDKVEGRDVYAVTDSHSHAWVEVYFPRFGWIPFEPTPGKALPGIYQPGVEDQEVFGTASIQAEPLDEGCLDESDDCFDPEESSALIGVDSSSTGGSSIVSLWPWLLAALAGTAVVGFTLGWLWKRFLAAPDNPRVAFRRMTTLAALAAAGQTEYQTPYQFGDRLQQVLPAQETPVSIIVAAYGRSRYGNKAATASERRVLSVAWRRLRLPMLWAVVRRRIR
ncbi:MAG: transglutaminase domain-containing protein [Chloroflexi bacterium]|nr:transglutaminase domain-containing protein [Chloroflexota bacterium]